MRLIERDQAMHLLLQSELADFWRELGFAIELPDHFYYLLEPDIGLFVIEPVEAYYGIHVAIFPGSRGKRALQAGREAIRWVLQRTTRVLARILRNQPETRFYAASCGMKRYSEDATHIYYEAISCQ
jgi:hypothetical protein